MMAWLLILPLALASGWAIVRTERSRLPLVGLTLALGLLGYAAAGRPDLPARPAPPPAVDPAAYPEMAEARRRLLSNAGDTGAWLTFADSLARQGRTQDAIEGLQVAARAMPDSPDLWVGLGNMLTIHAEGLITPAARLAFDRASALDPEHPAPRYFLGLAWLQAGRPREALAEWDRLRRRSPPGAPWIPELDRKMAAARTMIAAGIGDGG